MNLSELKNLDLGALLKGALTKNSSLRGPQAKMVLWGGFAALLFVAYIVFVFCLIWLSVNKWRKKLPPFQKWKQK